MKMLKLSSILVAGGIAAFGFAPSAFAFHDGGVAYCEGCHTMHNSKTNAPMNGHSAIDTGVKYLLQGTDQSSTCLNCHGSTSGGGYHILTTGLATGGTVLQFTPGGDFGWEALPTNATPPHSHHAPLPANRRGHSIVAADFINGAFGVADPDVTFAPGGSYSNQKLTCISCHNPHSNARIVDGNGTIAYATLGSAMPPIVGSGSYGATPTTDPTSGLTVGAVGVYRFLGGKGYVPASYSGGPSFTADPPVAVAPGTYNRSEAATQTRVAYGKGMSEWCANCHVNIHTTVGDAQSAPYIHPSGATALLSYASANISGATTSNAAIYNAYKSSGDLSGTQAGSYLSLVPFEEGTGTIATLAGHAAAGATGSQLAGPITGSENVMCLSCHRAHASGFDNMTRWSVTGDEFVTIAGAWPGVDQTNASAQQYSEGWTQTQYTAAMYNYPATTFGGTNSNQRSLCNKCHAKD